jgi:1-acyl-sn-glycerol-3-phosphate acyltransferase
MNTPSSSPLVRRALAAVAVRAILTAARLLTGVRGHWQGAAPSAEQTLYFANHASHGDFVLLWATLPRELRAITRPVAGEDYWQASALRRFIGHDVFNALMIRRDGSGADGDAANPVDQMAAALGAGDSLIMFPEGTRNTGDEVLLPLKSGLYHLARQCPQVRLVPVWIDNLKRVLPKGAMLPIPLACTVRYGAPIAPLPGEDKAAFLARARQAMLDLRPEYDRTDEPAKTATTGTAPNLSSEERP